MEGINIKCFIWHSDYFNIGIYLGSSVGILGVYFNIDKGSNNFVQAENPIWEKSTPQGDNWHLALVDYDGYNSSVANFIIEAHTGKTYLFGDISLGNYNLLDPLIALK